MSNKVYILVPTEINSPTFAPKSGIIGSDKGSYLHVCFESNLTNNPKLKSYTAKLKKAAEQLKKDLPGPETGFFRKNEFHIVGEYDLKKSYVTRVIEKKQKRLEEWCNSSLELLFGPIYKKEAIPDWDHFQKDVDTFAFISLKCKESEQLQYRTHYGQEFVYDKKTACLDLL